MTCPLCGKGSDVTDSRIVNAGVRRRRLCLNEHRFTTYERVVRPDLADALKEAAAWLA